MPVPLITSALTQAGLRLLDNLVDRARECAEATDLSVYTVLEHWLLSVRDSDMLTAALRETQDSFSSYAEAYQRWMEVFEQLLQHAGEEREPFLENIWRAYLFRSQNAAEILWDQYPEIQRRVAIETGRYLPHSWGEWILPLQTFMGIVEQNLVDQNQTFEDLFGSEDLLTLVENLPAHQPGPEFFQEQSIRFISGGQFDETTLIAYLAACADHVGHIDPRGYPRSVHTTVPLSDVFIPLRIVPLADYDQPSDYARYQTAGYDDPELAVFHEPLGHHELAAHSGVEISEILARHQRALILGERGAGKTTLLRHLTLEHARILLADQANALQIETGHDGAVQYRLARPLPVYVDLAAYVEYRQPGEALEDYIVRSAASLARDEGAARLLSTLLDNGQCLLLLDGLDQTATDEQRRMLVANVVELVEETCAAGNRVVVTSRFEGYHISPLPAHFAEFLIRPLSRNQINSFLFHWRLTLARMVRPLIGDDDARRQAQSEMLPLAREITTNPRLYALVNTPLLLRMLVGAYHPGMVLVPQRIAIYQLVAEVLIHEWRLPQRESQHPAVLEHEVIPLLGELAYWLHSTRASGQLSEQELREILGHIWGSIHPDATPEQVQTAIGDFLGTLRIHHGVLIELAPQRYGFIYQELQEYFAARHMVSSYRIAAERIREHLHDPRWDEVIALAVGFTALSSQGDASDLVEMAILARGGQAAQFGHASSPFESLLKRDLFLAARLLANGVEARPDTTRYVVRQLMALWLQGERDSLGRFNLIFDSARRHLINLDGTSASRVALQIAIEHLSSTDEHTQAYAVDALTFWPAHTTEAQRALVKLGVKAPVPVRRAAASALGRMPNLEKEAYEFLLALAADMDDQVSAYSQRALERAAPVPYELLRMWVDYLSSDDPVKRRVSMRHLQQIGSLPPAVIGELLRLLDDPDPSIRQRVVQTLARVVNLPDDALMAIYRAIADADPGFRATAISAFARPLELPRQVILQLVRWADDPDAGVRQAALAALGTCLNTDVEVIDALIERLDDGSDSIRAAAIEPLVLKGRDHPYALHMLTHTVSDPVYQVRCAIASALRHVPAPDENVQDVLNTLLSDREMIVRETALETVRQLDEPGPDVIDHLIALITMPDHPIRPLAVRAMAALRNLPERALLALIQSLHAYGDTLGGEVVACLRAHAPLSADVLNQAMDLAVLHDMGAGPGRHAPEILRALALEILSYTLWDTPAVLQVLLEAANQSDNARVRIAALRGLGHARVMSPGVLNTLGITLKNGMLEVRCAAGITLARLIRNLPDPPLEGEQLLDIARTLAALLAELPPRAAWERDSETQNEVLRALGWVVARARPSLPRLASRSEEPAGYFY